MNKKMRDLLNQMRTLQGQADKLAEEGNKDELAKVINKITCLRESYNTEKALFEMEQSNVPDNPEPKNKIVSGFKVIAKMLGKKGLTEAEDALIVNGEDGENYLVPEDVDNAIREARSGYQCLKDLLTVYPVSTLSGTNIYASEDDEELDAFEDGDTITDAKNPTFVPKKWTISFFGKIIPISNILRGAEKAGLMAYINRWFVRKAVRTENKKIIDKLKEGKSAVEIKGIAGIKKQINTGIESDYLVDGIILTNQTGYDMLDNETDAVGRPLLTADPKNPGVMLLKGLPVHKVSDKVLANEGNKAPIFIGSLKAGMGFYEYQHLQFAISEHVFFNKNQTGLRVIEGFDVLQEYPEAYIYGLLSADTGKTVKTEAAA